MIPRRGFGRVALAATAALLAACAAVAPPEGGRGEHLTTRLRLGGVDYGAEWWLPPAPARALLVLEPGWSRSCSRLRTTAAQIMARGLMVLCVDADMAQGNPALADALARALVEPGAALASPRELPQRLIVGGHSAGAGFAIRLGSDLATRAPDRLAGALLFDPVAGPGVEPELEALAAARPVLALTAQPGACNLQGQTEAALLKLAASPRPACGAALEVERIGAGSSHADVEGEDSDWIAAWACGRPLPGNVARLRARAADWVAAVAKAEAPLAAGCKP